jgi:DNA-binding XRE family transcriptional regulator
MDHEGKATEAVAPGVSTPQGPASLGGSSREHEARVEAPASPTASTPPSEEPKRKVKARPRPPATNQLRKFREELCLSQAELARRANLSALTVARIEQGYGCRMSTKRKILEALGLSLADRKRVFGEEE